MNLTGFETSISTFTSKLSSDFKRFNLQNHYRIRGNKILFSEGFRFQEVLSHKIQIANFENLMQNPLYL